MTPREFWLAAAEWGSYLNDWDPGACLYGFDERGTVQSEQHRADCIAWIDGPCRKAATANIAAGDPSARGDHEQLDELRAYLLTAPCDTLPSSDPRAIAAHAAVHGPESADGA